MKKNLASVVILTILVLISTNCQNQQPVPKPLKNTNTKATTKCRGISYEGLKNLSFMSQITQEAYLKERGLFPNKLGSQRIYKCENSAKPTVLQIALHTSNETSQSHLSTGERAKMVIRTIDLLLPNTDTAEARSYIDVGLALGELVFDQDITEANRNGELLYEVYRGQLIGDTAEVQMTLKMNDLRPKSKVMVRSMLLRL